MKQVRAARSLTRQTLLMEGSQEAPSARESRTSQIHLVTTAASCCTKTVRQREGIVSHRQTAASMATQAQYATEGVRVRGEGDGT
jgi:hypothetical protein